MEKELSNTALATLAAVHDAPLPPEIMRLHSRTRHYHKNPLSTLLTVVRLERAGLIKSKDNNGQIGYHITDAGREALGD